MTGPRRRGACAHCGNERMIQARGLCDTCYRKPEIRAAHQPGTQVPSGQDAIPATPCDGGCGAFVFTADRLCSHCGAHYRSAATYDPRKVPVSDVLYGGDWVVVRGVRRWVPWEASA